MNLLHLLSTSALPAFAAECRRLLHGAHSAPAARCILSAGCSATNLPAAVADVDGTAILPYADGVTDRWTLDRFHSFISFIFCSSNQQSQAVAIHNELDRKATKH